MRSTYSPQELYPFPSGKHLFPALAIFAGGVPRFPKTPNKRQREALIESSLNSNHVIGGGNEWEIVICSDSVRDVRAKQTNKEDVEPTYEDIVAAKRLASPLGLRIIHGVVALAHHEGSRGDVFRYRENSLLDILGHTLSKNRSYNTQVRRQIRALTNSLWGLTFYVKRKNRRGRIRQLDWHRFFTCPSGRKDMLSGALELDIRPESWWFPFNFSHRTLKDSKAFVRLPLALAQENHDSHGLTLLLTTLLACKWRINLGEPVKLSDKSLNDWLGRGDLSQTKLTSLLRRELDYMMERSYLGRWNLTEGHRGKDNLYEFNPPDWLAHSLLEIEKAKERITAAALNRKTDC